MRTRIKLLLRKSPAVPYGAAGLFHRIAAATVGARLVSMLVNYTLENLLSQYDCLVVVEPDRAEQQMLQKHFDVDGSAGFYRIEKDTVKSYAQIRLQTLAENEVSRQ